MRANTRTFRNIPCLLAKPRKGTEDTGCGKQSYQPVDASMVPKR